MISKEKYIDYSGKGFNLVPIIKELEIDSDSPITLYSKIKNKSIVKIKSSRNVFFQQCK